MLQKVLDFVRESMAAAAKHGGRSEYARGYVNAHEDIEEYILDLMWEEGDEG